LGRKARWAIGAAALAVVLAGVVVAYVLVRAQWFPRRYRALVREAAEEFGLDPLLVAALVHRESGFRPEARSRAGARGLMQLMPATAEEVAGKLGLDGYSEAMLEEPRVNLRLGCAYLRELLDRFGGDERVALAAYNAGYGKVDRWLKEARGDVERMMEECAFPETRRYVHDVLGTRWVLRRLDSIRAF
jgi:soluble lytic murein transglycosylase